MARGAYFGRSPCFVQRPHEDPGKPKRIGVERDLAFFTGDRRPHAYTSNDRHRSRIVGAIGVGEGHG
jgi:hypothetical protein